MSIALRERDLYLTDFVDLQKERETLDPSWLKELREDAMRIFTQKGFPTLKDEPWRFTNLTPIARTDFTLAPLGRIDEARLARIEFSDFGIPRLVFVNGRVAPELSTGLDRLQGVRVLPLSKAIQSREPALERYYGRCGDYEEHAFSALNLAFSSEGAFIHVSKGAVVETPLHLLHIHTDAVDPYRVHPRTLLLAEESSEFTFLESFLGIGDNAYLCSPVTETVVGDNAKIDHYRLQKESRRAYHIGVNQVQQGRDSSYVSCGIDLGATLTRNDLSCVLNGTGGWSGLNGLYLLNQKQHVDNFTTLRHSAAHCNSREMFKGILDDSARGIFRGRIIVDKGAQKTDSKQTNQNLLLSDKAFVNTKPQLEIYADDVKCTHGATIGQLDETALFYFRSRGIHQTAARSLLVYAFASEVLETLKVTPLKEALVSYLTAWLPKGDLVRELYQE